MDPISALNQAMLLLREQLAEKSPRNERSSGRQARAVSPPTTSVSRDVSVEDAIRKQVKALRASGIEDEGQLFRVAIGILLQREFGAGLGNDPAFQQMGDWVCACLQEQEHTRRMLRTLIDT
ncbi:hypothetical protein [Paraburkholderia terricola]|uniref:Uncharacterized protein n=1 Tax=Paraburkholderia terricola TaxID=169427 RepID=A0ABU1LX43_9BURK|nr:hypothetical protein [Paraburkholderia terricola]MDR6411325.1 hypothetical protein [Paraburkholderia terricola]MDR6483435.1 hypothetical protein [Paraburkholderia terricola]